MLTEDDDPNDDSQYDSEMPEESAVESDDDSSESGTPSEYDEDDDDHSDESTIECDLEKGPPATGRPLPAELRARVMALLEDQCSISEVARRLLISRRTIHRYIRAADEQDTNVPEPGLSGGPNNVKVQRKDLLRWVKLVPH